MEHRSLKKRDREAKKQQKRERKMQRRQARQAAKHQEDPAELAESQQIFTTQDVEGEGRRKC